MHIYNYLRNYTETLDELRKLTSRRGAYMIISTIYDLSRMLMTRELGVVTPVEQVEKGGKVRK